MSELRKAAQALVDRWDTPLWKEAPHTGTFIDALRAALAQPEPIISSEIKPDKAEFDAMRMNYAQALQDIERLQRALRYEENRFSRIGTHGPDCWKWGPGHYECALRHIESI